MNERTEQFRELIKSGLKGGRFYLPTASGRTIQFHFTRDKVTKKFILQCYDGPHWLWTSYDNISAKLIKDFNEIIEQYTDI
jgi:hypothetical protein